MSENIDTLQKGIMVGENLLKEYCKYSTKAGKLAAATVKIGSIKAVDNVNISIDEGEFIAVMGPSGSGKSTLVNLLSTMDTPTRGNVYIEGRKLRTMYQEEIAQFRYKTIGFVFQEFNLLNLLTCAENISAPLVLNNEKKGVIETKVKEIAEILGIEDLLSKYPEECSGGQKQRVATARALVTNPKIIVADEPTGNLDRASSKRVMNFFKELNEERNITVLMVTHDPMIASYAKKVLYLRDGKIEKFVEKKAKTQKEFFDEVLELVSEDAVF